MQTEMVRYGLWAVAVSCTLVGLLWYFVTRALADQTPVLGSRNGGSGASGTRTDSGSAT